MLRGGRWRVTLLPSRKLPISLHFGSLEAQGVLGGAEMDVKVQGDEGDKMLPHGKQAFITMLTEGLYLEGCEKQTLVNKKNYIILKKSQGPLKFHYFQSALSHILIFCGRIEFLVHKFTKQYQHFQISRIGNKGMVRCSLREMNVFPLISGQLTVSRSVQMDSPPSST